MKSVQYFSPEYLENCRKMTPRQIVEFLEDFRRIASTSAPDRAEKSVLISMKISPSLLDAFKVKARMTNIPYQTQIKKLMAQWLWNS